MSALLEEFWFLWRCYLDGTKRLVAQTE